MAETDTPGPTPVGLYLKGLREEAGIPQRELSRRAGLAPSYVGQIESGAPGKRRPGRDILDQLAAALGVTGTRQHRRLLELGGYKPPADEDRPTFEVFLRGDPYLTADQRRALVTSYEAFVRMNRARQS